MTKVLDPSQYGPNSDGSFMGITLDRDGRMYMVGNHGDWNQKPAMSIVTIYRTAPVQNHHPADPCRGFASRFRSASTPSTTA